MIRRAFPEKPALRWILRILALFGAACAVFLLFRRARAELRSDRAACAITYADVRTLAAADGRGERQWLDDLSAAGVAYLIVGEDDRADGEAAAAGTGLQLAAMGSAAQDGDAFLLPAISGDETVIAALHPENARCLACVEDLSRTGLLLPDGLDPDALPCPAVKTLWMYERYRICRAEDTPYSEPCNILFRAVTERGMRLLILAPLEGDAGIVADPGAYKTLVSDLAARLSPRGITLGDTFSALEAPAADRVLIAGALLLLVGAAVLLLKLAVPALPDGVTAALLSVGSVGVIALGLARPAAAMTLGSFAAALVGGCAAARLLFTVWRDETIVRRGAFSIYLGVLLRLLLAGLLGGLYVGALLSCRSYMLGFTVFRGVKAAQAVPLLAAALALVQAVRAGGGAILPKGKGRILTLAVLAALLLCGGALLLLRSGDAGGFVSAFELRARNWLERVLFVRPRSKEMLLAVPAAALFALSLRYKHALFGVVFGVCAALETVSVINSFCHIVTPLHVTLIRTALGALIGFVLGAAVCLLLHLLLRKKAA